MSETVLCEACKAFLQGNLTIHGRGPLYKHHDTASSFEFAQELGCKICIRLHEAFIAEHKLAKKDMMAYCSRIKGTSVYRNLKHIVRSHLPYIVIQFSFRLEITQGNLYDYGRVTLLFERYAGQAFRNVHRLWV
ncbi:hypothetical protein DE146DRAFT_672880 [Phaeosphaeria sp. MPI-PUGE-AT-0046c]|nr:hypothetical protein DE146DRAFT_672880 [Phaeosphaeria sp. MPI-PUGE-AT-0046c]